MKTNKMQPFNQASLSLHCKHLKAVQSVTVSLYVSCLFRVFHIIRLDFSYNKENMHLYRFFFFAEKPNQKAILYLIKFYSVDFICGMINEQVLNKEDLVIDGVDLFFPSHTVQPFTHIFTEFIFVSLRTLKS